MCVPFYFGVFEICQYVDGLFCCRFCFNWSLQPQDLNGFVANISIEEKSSKLPNLSNRYCLQTLKRKRYIQHIQHLVDTVYLWNMSNFGSFTCLRPSNNFTSSTYRTEAISLCFIYPDNLKPSSISREIKLCHQLFFLSLCCGLNFPTNTSARLIDISLYPTWRLYYSWNRKTNEVFTVRFLLFSKSCYCPVSNRSKKGWAYLRNLWNTIFFYVFVG